jgi:hypothetical protein
VVIDEDRSETEWQCYQKSENIHDGTWIQDQVARGIDWELPYLSADVRANVLSFLTRLMHFDKSQRVSTGGALAQSFVTSCDQDEAKRLITQLQAAA